MSIAIHWFRRDLRLRDNSALTEAQRRHDGVLPVFVLYDGLLRRADMGAPRLTFLLESLADLARELERLGSRLIVRRGSPIREIPDLLRATGAVALTVNRDYGPYARRRDRGFAPRQGRGTLAGIPGPAPRRARSLRQGRRPALHRLHPAPAAAGA